jgi:hypothetical protein
MSWWDSGQDVLGDGPADLLTSGWRTLHARRTERGEGLPTTAEMLQSFVAAVRAANLTDPPLTRIVMWRARERLGEFDGSTPVADITDAFTSVLESIARDYQRQVDRPPRPSELAKTLAFIVRPSPGSYVSDAPAEGWTGVRLQAE